VLARSSLGNGKRTSRAGLATFLAIWLLCAVIVFGMVVRHFTYNPMPGFVLYGTVVSLLSALEPGTR
jgi:hypothetical protein